MLGLFRSRNPSPGDHFVQMLAAHREAMETGSAAVSAYEARDFRAAADLAATAETLFTTVILQTNYLMPHAGETVGKTRGGSPLRVPTAAELGSMRAGAQGNAESASMLRFNALCSRARDLGPGPRRLELLQGGRAENPVATANELRTKLKRHIKGMGYETEQLEFISPEDWDKRHGDWMAVDDGLGGGIMVVGEGTSFLDAIAGAGGGHRESYESLQKFLERHGWWWYAMTTWALRLYPSGDKFDLGPEGNPITSEDLEYFDANEQANIELVEAWAPSWGYAEPGVHLSDQGDIAESFVRAEFAVPIQCTKAMEEDEMAAIAKTSKRLVRTAMNKALAVPEPQLSFRGKAWGRRAKRTVDFERLGSDDPKRMEWDPRQGQLVWASVNELSWSSSKPVKYELRFVVDLPVSAHRSALRRDLVAVDGLNAAMPAIAKWFLRKCKGVGEMTPLKERRRPRAGQWPPPPSPPRGRVAQMELVQTAPRPNPSEVEVYDVATAPVGEKNQLEVATLRYVGDASVILGDDGMTDAQRRELLRALSSGEEFVANPGAADAWMARRLS